MRLSLANLHSPLSALLGFFGLFFPSLESSPGKFNFRGTPLSRQMKGPRQREVAEGENEGKKKDQLGGVKQQWQIQSSLRSYCLKTTKMKGEAPFGYSGHVSLKAFSSFLLSVFHISLGFRWHVASSLSQTHPSSQAQSDKRRGKNFFPSVPV